MSNVAALIAAAQQAKEIASTDMTQAQKGGQKARLLPEGMTIARLVGYIEAGRQPNSYQGKPKDPVDKFRLVFAVYDEGFANDDGTPYLAETNWINQGRNEKSTAYKLFKQLNWDGRATWWTDFIADVNGLVCQPVLLTIEHFKGGKDKKETKSGIKLDGFLPPQDPRTRKLYDLPAIDENLVQLFLWEFPTLEGWDGLRSFLQGDILKAVNFPGSALEELLITNGRPTTPAPKGEEPEEEDPQDDPQDAPANPAPVQRRPAMAMPQPE